MIGFRLFLNHFERIQKSQGELISELCFTEHENNNVQRSGWGEHTPFIWSITWSISAFAGVFFSRSVTSSTPSINPLPLTSPITTMDIEKRKNISMLSENFERKTILPEWGQVTYSRICPSELRVVFWDEYQRHEHFLEAFPSRSLWEQHVLQKCRQGFHQTCWDNYDELGHLRFPVWLLLHRGECHSLYPEKSKSKHWKKWDKNLSKFWKCSNRT